MRHPTPIRRILATLRAVISLGCVAALCLIRPGWPHIASLTVPLTTGEVQEIMLAVVWLLALGLALVLLTNSTRSLRHRRPGPAILPGVLPSRPARPPRSAHTAPRGSYVLTIPPPPAGSHLARDAAAPTPKESSPTSLPADAHAQADSRTISIAVLGPVAIDGLKHRIKRAATRELLTYLALHPSGASRDELVEALWPAQDPDRTRPRFYQSVTEARKALGDAWIHHDERYRLDRTKVRIDLDDLSRLTQDAEPTALEQALALWRGEPLEGTDYLWADSHTRNLRATLLDLLERVGRNRFAHHDAKAALQIAEQAITLDHLHEPSWRLALQAEHALGQREGITRRYDELTHTLDEQLGLKPARETRTIYRQLLAQG
jgi:DNA-binding SARP family transcriptional activator